MNPERSEVDDEYEYEYDYSQTESFYVDLDLSSLNSGPKGSTSGARAKKASKSAGKRKPAASTPDQDEDSPDVIAQDGEENMASQPSPSTQQDGDEPADPELKLEILDMDSVNPIVAYDGHIFSCAWIDMIGTNMFLTKPDAAQNVEPLQSTDDYDLLAMSRIKLLGHRAVMKKIPAKKRRRAEDESYHDEQSTGTGDKDTEGKSLGTMHRNNAKLNIQLKNQASFLEKLMEIKRRRGEHDVVRTYADDRFAPADQTNMDEDTLQEIDALNQRIVKGDAEAVKRLQKIYSRLDDEAMKSP